MTDSDPVAALIPRISEIFEAAHNGIRSRLFCLLVAVADRGVWPPSLAFRDEKAELGWEKNGLATLDAAMFQETAARSAADGVDESCWVALLHQTAEAIGCAQTQMADTAEVLRGLVDLTDESRRRNLKEVQRLLAGARRLLSSRESDANMALPRQTAQAIGAAQTWIAEMTEVLRQVVDVTANSRRQDLDAVQRLLAHAKKLLSSHQLSESPRDSASPDTFQARLFCVLINAVADEGARLSMGLEENGSPALDAAMFQEAAARSAADGVDRQIPESRLDTNMALLRQAAETVGWVQRRMAELTEVLRGLVDLTDESRRRDLKEVQRLLAGARRLLSSRESDANMALPRQTAQAIGAAQTWIAEMTEVLRQVVDLTDSSRRRDLDAVQRLLAHAKKLLLPGTWSTAPAVVGSRAR